MFFCNLVYLVKVYLRSSVSREHEEDLHNLVYGKCNRSRASSQTRCRYHSCQLAGPLAACMEHHIVTQQLHSHGNGVVCQPLVPNRQAWKQQVRSASNGIKAGLQVLCFCVCCFVFLCWGDSPGWCGLAFGGCCHMLQRLSSNLCQHLHNKNIHQEW